MSELKDILARRRRMSATAGSNNNNEEEEEGSITDLQQLDTAEISKSDSRSNWDPNGSTRSEMSSDLQSKLERRRKMADSVSSGLQVDTAAHHQPVSPHLTSNSSSSMASPSAASVLASPVREDLKAFAMGSDLQAIMARRRRLAGDDDDDQHQAPDPDAAASSSVSSPPTGNDPPADASLAGGHDSWKATGHSRKMQDDTTNASEDDPEDIVSVDEARGGRKPRRRKKPKEPQTPSQAALQQSPPTRKSKPRSSRARKPDGDERSVDVSVASQGSTSGGRKSRRPGTSSSDESTTTPGTGKGRSKRRPGRKPSSDEDRRRGTRRQKSSESLHTITKPNEGLSPPAASSGEEDAPKPQRKSSSRPKESAASSLAKPKKVRSPSEGDSSPEKKNTDSAPGWGDFPAFASGGTTTAAGFDDAAFASFPSDSNTGFGNLDASFPPSTTTKNDTSDANASNKSLTKMDFDAFNPAAFESDSAFNAFGSSNHGSSTFDAGFSKPFPPAPPKKAWDKTPLPSSELPRRALPHLALHQKQLFSCDFERPPINNPLNGNIIFCSKRNGSFHLQEVDPRRGCVQVSAVPVLSSEFKRKVAAKYNASVHMVDAVLSIGAGLHFSNGQTRTRVAAILDLGVLESKHIVRVIAVWQWGYGSPHPVTLQYVLSPPSGADFAFDTSSLQNADGLLFLAGQSPKGPCMFMCKPSAKETWSANFLAGSGKIVSVAVTSDLQRLYPYIAIALDDGTLCVWTYGSALSAAGSRDAAGGSKRWLFPLCRLEHARTFAFTEASSPNEQEVVVGKGKSTHAVEVLEKTCRRPSLTGTTTQMQKKSAFARSWSGCLQSLCYRLCS